jgi:UDP-glucose 4-epimerase
MAIDLSSQRVAVTGAGGFTGLHLMRRLHAAGADIIAIAVAGKPTPGLDALPFSFERILVEDVRTMGDAIRQAAPRYVVHLSGFISTERSLPIIRQTMDWNLISTISLLTACTEVHAERVILMGSGDEYGQKFSPFDPARAPDPSFQLPTVVLRPSVAYGPGQSPRQLISMVMRALAEGRPIDVTLGEQTRDFIYIEDTISIIMEALLADGILGEDYNVGSGEIVTVRHCLELIERITGRSRLIQYGGRPYPAGERFHYEPLLEKTYKAFQWRPTVMLEEGLLRTWHSFRKED